MRFSLFIRLICWGYLLLALLLWLLVSLAGDRWWPATLILFSPRWIAALPLVILLPLALWRNRFSLIPLLIGALIVFGPFMGLNLPIGKAALTGGKTLRVMTCNIDKGNCDMQALAVLIRETRADIVALQEFPQDLQLSRLQGWQIIQERGMAILSRFPMQRGMTVQVYNPPDPWPKTCLIHCIVTTSDGDVNFCSVQLPTPRYGLLPILDKYTILRPSRNGQLLAETEYRRRASLEVQKMVATLSDHTIVAGDFNMPVDSAIYRHVWNGYNNAFSTAGIGYGWTQRAKVKRLAASIGIRIDHILTGKGLAPHLCEVGPDVGSDHLPLVADVEVKPVTVKISR